MLEQKHLKKESFLTLCRAHISGETCPPAQQLQGMDRLSLCIHTFLGNTHAATQKTRGLEGRRHLQILMSRRSFSGPQRS